MALAAHSKYLAQHVLSDKEVVLAQGLDPGIGRIDVGFARGQLKELGHHATYVITGVPAAQGIAPSAYNDVDMASDPSVDRSTHAEEEETETVPQAMVAVCRESSVEASKSMFAEIHCIQIYSIGPSAVNDLYTLPTGILIAANGPEARRPPMIQNSRAQRRTDATVPSFVKDQDTQRTLDSGTSPSPTPEVERPSELSLSQSKTIGPKRNASKPPATSRQNSNILKSFARTQPKKQDSNASIANQSARSSQERSEQQVDVAMKGSSDEDDGKGDGLPPVDIGGTNPRAKREEQLKQMMDDEEDATRSESQMQVEQPTKAEDEDPKEQSTTVSNGRRRGKRKVTRKRTMQDSEGYLITKEEPFWESFSEEEPKPAQKLRPVQHRVNSSAGSKGRGNIMSFFGKQ